MVEYPLRPVRIPHWQIMQLLIALLFELASPEPREKAQIGGVILAGLVREEWERVPLAVAGAAETEKVLGLRMLIVSPFPNACRSESKPLWTREAMPRAFSR